LRELEAGSSGDSDKVLEAVQKGVRSGSLVRNA